MSNPLLETWLTPYSTPPFTEIKTEHFRPAIEEAIKLARQEIDEITDNTEPPTFSNTVAALDMTGEKLAGITSIIFNLNSAETSRELQQAAQDVSPLLTSFSNDITLNNKLFERIKKIFENIDTSDLTTEERILTEKKYRNFMLGGAGLVDTDRKRFREITEELAMLSLKFEENVLAETNKWELHLTDEADLIGLPEGIRSMAASEAKKRNKEGWVFTLHYPSYVPFMQYSENRALREKMLRAYSSRSFHGDENDNRSNVLRITNLRLELARMLGFRNYAEMILGDRMADTPEKVNNFLDELFNASSDAAHDDFSSMISFAGETGHDESFERWDWSFFSEKLKRKLYDIDDELLRPYFPLEKAEEAIFGLAGKLYGLSFRRNYAIQVYHPEVNVFEVYDNDLLMALLYTDYFPRTGKNGGAWMTTYRDQRKINGADIRPLVSIVANFTRADEKTPSLLSFTELTTFLHEFGHALHGILSQCTYESLSGTSVARDFVELPSQFMENFAYEKEWLDTWAAHYKTGEKLPGEWISKIKESAVFNEGYSCFRQLSFSLLDMAWHTVNEPVNEDVAKFESAAMKKTELFPPVDGLNMSVQFGHIFGGGYASGYYGYKWAEVLDADAFEMFREKGIFNKETAVSFRENILSKGGTEKPLDLFKKFRGREPSIDPFLRRSGLTRRG